MFMRLPAFGLLEPRVVYLSVKRSVAGEDRYPASSPFAPASINAMVCGRP